jgi:hypothetical protein
MASNAGKLFQKKLVHHKLVVAIDQIESAIYDLRNNDEEQLDVVPGIQAALVALKGAQGVLSEKLRGQDLTLSGGNPDMMPQN